MKLIVAGILAVAAASACRGVQAQDAPWPPELHGAVRGTVTLTSPSFLEIPEAVRAEAEKEGAAPFDVAKTPPKVELAFHCDLGPDAAARRLWSSWGDICVARDGRVYCGIGDHGNDVGGDARAFLHRWDPQSRVLEKIVDMNQVVPPKAGQPAWSKIHAKIDEGPDGKIYFSCTLNDGNRAKLPTHGFNEQLPGGQLYQFDPAAGKTTVFANLPPRRCTATSLIDFQRNIWWCNLEAGEGNALWGLNLATRKPVFQAPDGSMGFNRSFALAADGSIFFNGPDRLMKYDAATGQIAKTAAVFDKSPGMRSSTAESKDGFLYGSTQLTNQLFRYGVKSDDLKLLGPNWLTGSYTTVIVLSPDERFLYYLPGSHGGAFKHGTPVVQYDLARGRRKVLAFLAPPFEKEHEYVPAGTYGMKISADGGTLFVNFNGHATDRLRPKHLKAIGFGLCSFAAIHIPESERQAGLTNRKAANAALRVEHNVAVPMRDGCVLRADVVRPAGDGPFPVLVMRTPYGKSAKFDTLAKAGYIVVSQDARGRYASEGRFESLVRFQTYDAEDGYDTIEWAAKLPGSTGKVGTFGVSYNAFLQWRLAALRPPSLAAMAAFSIPARYTDLEGPGTIRPGRRLKWWFGTLAPDMHLRSGGPKPHTMAEGKSRWDESEGDKLLGTLPWTRLPDEMFGHEAEAVRAWLRNPHTDPWKLDEACAEVAVPNLNVCGWYDHCNSIDLHTALVAKGKGDAAHSGSRLVVGPWSHNSLGNGKYGNIHFGPEGQMDLTALQLRWFDYWLKGKDNGADRDPRVKIFVMGPNRWRDEAQWPLSRAKPLEMFLASGGSANTPKGNGRLVTASSSGESFDHYTYDPHDPVPTQWTKELFTIPADQRPLAQRKDILVYQTEPLAEALEVTGYPEVELHAASKAPDTDFFARLIDVAPDGMARAVTQGMVRARFRDGLERPQLLKPGEIARFKIRLGPTCNQFLPGHRLRLDITSSDFPNYDRNHNTAADQNADATLAVAEQTVYHDAEHPSRLILPVVAVGERE